MTAAVTRAERPYDPADISSLEFWSGTAKDRENVFSELRTHRPISWHRPVKNGLFEDEIVPMQTKMKLVNKETKEESLVDYVVSKDECTIVEGAPTSARTSKVEPALSYEGAIRELLATHPSTMRTLAEVRAGRQIWVERRRLDQRPDIGIACRDDAPGNPVDCEREVT